MLALLKRGLVAASIILAPLSAFAQSFPQKYDSAATTNATQVIVGKTQLRSLVLTNSTINLYWLKLYDVSATPTCNSSTVAFKVPFPYAPVATGSLTAQSNVSSVQIPDGIQFQNGIGFCITAGQSDTDNTNAATGLVVNFGVKQ